MSWSELKDVVGRIISLDESSPELYKPIVAIGHSKDLVDFLTIEKLLRLLRAKEICVTDFRSVKERIGPSMSGL
jgi:hypothetical protein